MKKMLRVILSLSAMAIASSTSLITIACDINDALLDDPYVEIYKDYYNWYDSNPYLDFLNTSDTNLNHLASSSENKKFNALYDAGSTVANTWSNILSLDYDLKNWRLSDSVKVNIDWKNMYREVSLNPVDTATALDQQLRFYNILAKLYHKENVLKLLQWVRATSQQESKVIAYNQYYPGVNSQTQTYGPLFANKTLINSQYQQKFWSTDNLITISTHEYGHALSNFLSASTVERAHFNNIYISSSNTFNKLKANSKLTAYNFTDRTQVLINFLDEDAVKKGIVTLNNDVQKFLFVLLVVFSGYSASAWKYNNINQRDDFFAEAFAYWILTPQDIRDTRWALLNDFFIDYVPIFYNV